MEKFAVVIGTTKGREAWLNDCLKSIDVPIPVIVACMGGYELGKIRWVYEDTKIDRFAFLQDSVVMQNNSFLMKAFSDPFSVCLFHDGICLNGYMGIYDRKVLDTIEIPIVTSKYESVVEEFNFTAQYIEACGEGNFDHSFDSTGRTIGESCFMRHGRANMVYTNPMMQKWKGNWGQMPNRDWEADDQQYLDFLRGNAESPFGNGENLA